MTDIILGLIIGALLVKAYFDERDNKIERERLMKALMAKNLQDYTASEIIDKEPTPEVIPDEVPMDTASESLFEKHLKNLENATATSEY